MKLGFIGGGIMAESIITGILNSRLDADIRVGDPDPNRISHLKTIQGISVSNNNNDAILGADIIILAVKPQQFDKLSIELKRIIQPEQTIISIMAGVKLHSIGLKLNHRRLIRVMPNTPAQVMEGISAWTTSQDVPDKIVKFTGQMLNSLGDEIKFSEEHHIDIATALSASGPGYVFVFIESLIDAGVKLGLPAHEAKKLSIQTVLGSAFLAKKTQRHPAELKNMVTSPGGTTAAGLKVLEDGGLRSNILSAVEAAYNRGEELSKGK